MGVGKALYDALAERIRPMGIRKVELKVWAFNESAMGFYEALGMKPQNIIMEGHI
ncbi:MAG: GNAT family N-acetyltransferase [Eisenbergiella sp.]